MNKTATSTPTSSSMPLAPANIVLTQPLLVSLITSYQSGVLGIARALVAHAAAANMSSPPALHAPHGHRLHSLRARRNATLLRGRRVPEALVRFDGEDLYVIQVALRAATFAHHDNRLCGWRTCAHAHRLCEAAAAFGRVDVLRFRYAQRECEQLLNAPLQSSCVTIAGKRGHINVLSWFEATYGPSPLEGLRGKYKVLTEWPPSHHDLSTEMAVFTWFADRALGEFALELVEHALGRGDVELVRVCLLRYQPPSYPQPELMSAAVRSGHLPVVRLLMDEYKVGFVLAFVELALDLRHDDVALYLMTRRHDRLLAGTSMLSWSAIRKLVAAQELDRLARLIASLPDCAEAGVTIAALSYFSTPVDLRGAIQLLLPVSSLAATAATLTRMAIDRHPATNVLLACAPSMFPPALEAFVERALHDQLGPLAIEAAGNAMQQEIQNALPTASRDDVRDAALCLWLRAQWFRLPWVLEYDEARADGRVDCDVDFLTDLFPFCPDDQHRRCLENSIQARVAREDARVELLE